MFVLESLFLFYIFLFFCLSIEILYHFRLLLPTPSVSLLALPQGGPTTSQRGPQGTVQLVIETTISAPNSITATQVDSVANTHHFTISCKCK